MCRLVVDEEQRIFCEDASRDPRFSYSSFVAGPEPVRFYVSLPLRVADGTVVGTLCSWDTVARELDAEQLARLEDLAEQLAARMEGRRPGGGRAGRHRDVRGEGVGDGADPGRVGSGLNRFGSSVRHWHELFMSTSQSLAPIAARRQLRARR
jgi:hypothetical protein